MNRKKADFLIMFITAMWGFGSIGTTIGLRQLGPMQLNAARFLLGFLIPYFVFFKKMKGVSRVTAKASAVLGILLALVYTLCTYAIAYTKVTKLGFIFALTSVFVPLLNLIFRKIRLDLKTVICIIVSVIGLAMLTLRGAEGGIELGDMLALLSALVYALYVILTEIYITDKGADALQLGVLNIGAASVLLIIAALFAGETAGVIDRATVLSVLFLAVMSTAFPFICQPIAMRYTTSNHAGIVMSLEPVFTAAGSYVVLNERLDGGAYLGGLIMLAAVIMLNVDIPKRKNERS